MKYVKWTRYGKAEVLKIANKEKPVPKDDELLIKIHATSVSAGDCELRSLSHSLVFRIMLRLVFGIFKPRKAVLGQEFAGVVEATGKDVRKFKVGDRVFATTGLSLGGYAEYKCMKENPGEKALIKMSDKMTFEEAAGLPIGGLEALHFVKKSNVKKNQKVLINGSGGSIGTVALQLFKYYGAEVTAIDSDDKLEMLKSIGADYTIDYEKEDFLKANKKYDVILDVVGKASFKGCIDSLNSNGTLLLSNPSSSDKKNARRNRTNINICHKPALHVNKDLEFIRDLVDSGDLKPVIDKVMSIEEIVQAHEYVEAGLKKGNLIIKINA